MSKWEMVRLGDVCKITKGKKHNTISDYSEGTIRYIQIDDLRNNSNMKYTDSILGTDVIETDLIIAWDGANAGLSHYGLVGKIGSTLARIRPEKDMFNEKYLGYYLKQQRQGIRDNCTGATIPHVRKSYLESIRIPKPPLDIQIKIADALEKAESLILQKKEQIKGMDELIESLFYDMFGDPISNPMKWDSDILENYLDSIDSGWSPKCMNRKADKNSWGVLKLSAVTGNKYRESENKQLPNDLNPKSNKEVKIGDLLFSRKNTIELVGACAYVYKSRDKLLIPDIIFRFNTKETLSKLYLWGLLTCNSFRNNITSLAGGSAASMLNISKAKLMKLEIPVPPIVLQNQFADKVHAIEMKKEEMLKGLEELEEMFNSIMQKSFRGELF